MDNRMELVDLTKSFKNFKLNQLSFEVPKGYVTGFIGRNGSGKTTAIRSMLSLIHFEGQILENGQPISQNYDYLQNVGIVMDEPLLGQDWDMQLVNQVMSLGYQQWDMDKYYNYLKQFDIHENLKVKELSKGMKIKLMLAIALSHNADILILDEPTSGLDPQMRDEFVTLIQDFMSEENHTVLFSTHITQDLEMIADYIVYIDQGLLLKACSKEDFVEQYRVLVGSSGDIERINGEAILGRKDSLVNTEVLIESEWLEQLDASLFDVQIPSIDRVMMLYGRIK